jgi:hypothetical protein
MVTHLYELYRPLLAHAAILECCHLHIVDKSNQANLNVALVIDWYMQDIIALGQLYA